MNRFFDVIASRPISRLPINYPQSWKGRPANVASGRSSRSAAVFATFPRPGWASLIDVMIQIVHPRTQAETVAWGPG
jgi:hypothetical protein